MTDTTTSSTELLPHGSDDVAARRNLLTVEEAAQRLALGRTTVYALLKDGQISSVRIGRLRRIPVEALAAYTARLLVEQNRA